MEMLDTCNKFMSHDVIEHMLQKPIEYFINICISKKV